MHHGLIALWAICATGYMRNGLYAPWANSAMGYMHYGFGSSKKNCLTCRDALEVSYTAKFLLDNTLGHSILHFMAGLQTHQ